MRRWSVGKPSVLIPNLLQRQFTVTRRNKAWVTDITYIRTWQGWLYLAVVMDLFSRKIVGWSAGPTIHRELVLDAVLMAVRRRRPRGTLDSFRSGHAVRQRRVAAILPLQSPRAEHEPEGQLLGQCRRRVLLQQLEEGADQEADLQEPRAGDDTTLPTTSIASTIERAATVISAASARSSSKRLTNRADGVSTESWELHKRHLEIIQRNGQGVPPAGVGSSARQTLGNHRRERCATEWIAQWHCGRLSE